jgi:hypothetical protein
LFAIYVVASLSIIKYQLNKIIKHLDIKEEDPLVSNEEIEKELEDEIRY